MNCGSTFLLKNHFEITLIYIAKWRALCSWFQECFPLKTKRPVPQRKPILKWAVSKPSECIQDYFDLCFKMQSTFFFISRMFLSWKLKYVTRNENQSKTGEFLSHQNASPDNIYQIERNGAKPLVLFFLFLFCIPQMMLALRGAPA